jgi:hypothetical protein
MQAPYANPSEPTPRPGESTGAERSKGLWRSRGGLIKMVGLVVEGVGVIVSGLSLSYVVTEVNSTGNNAVTLYTNFFHTLEAGIVISGVGVILLGIGFFVGSRRA